MLDLTDIHDSMYPCFVQRVRHIFAIAHLVLVMASYAQPTYFKHYYLSNFVYHSDMPKFDILDSDMLAGIQEVSIAYLFLGHRCQRSVAHVAQRLSDMYPD